MKREPRPLREQLTQGATLQELEVAMEQDEQLKIILTTPAPDLPEPYMKLVWELSSISPFNTLYDYIQLSFVGEGMHCEFSKAGNKYVGFIAYRIYPNEPTVVNGIKMFPFDVQKPLIIMRDLKKLLDNLLQTYATIKWKVREDNNTAITIYDKACEIYKGTKNPLYNRNNVLYGYEYVIT